MTRSPRSTFPLLTKPCEPTDVTRYADPANKMRTRWEPPDAVAPLDSVRRCSRPRAGRRRCRWAACGRRTLHLAGLLVLPAGQRLSQRDGARPARRAAARLPRHLLGPAPPGGAGLAVSTAPPRE